MSSDHKLAAIIFADIAGYTEAMEKDEQNALELLHRFKEVVETVTPGHEGRVVQYFGDGCLLSFESSTDSVDCAIALQQAFSRSPEVPVRIGMHLGEVIFREGNVFGDGVNIASRIESLGIPGAILMSKTIRDQIKNKTDFLLVSLGSFDFKNVGEPMEVFALANPGFVVPRREQMHGKLKEDHQGTSILRRVKGVLVKVALPVLIVGALGLFFIPPRVKKLNARSKLLPAIQTMVNEEFFPSTKAYDMALEAEKYLPRDSTLVKLWPVIATTVSIKTEPAGSEVLWKDYDAPTSEWRLAGVTPLDSVRLPRGYLRMLIRKKGFQPIEYAGPIQYKRLGADIAHLKLDAAGSLPVNMVRIPKNEANMIIVGLEQHGGRAVGEFLIDRYEVTNAAYKAFMDGGGYANKKYWTHRVYLEGKEIALDSAMSLFVDRTGRQGPANWEAGTYPDGQENHPVTGVSWYEAAAFAAWANKQLPTVFHWSVVAETSRTQYIVPLSNYNGKSTVPVGSMAGYSTFGVYDLAGNAREWCFNESNVPGQRYVLGGGWNDPTYSFNDGYTQPALDRSVANGFRCIKVLPGDTAFRHLTVPVAMAFRDYRKEKPVDDKTFEIYLRQFTYDKGPLNARVEATLEEEFWKVEKISFDAGYNNERMEAYLYLPRNFKPPYQPVLFFPGSGVIFSKKYDPMSINGRIDFLLKSGRALICPIFKGTHERHDDLKSDLQEETVFYKDHVIMWRKDIGRTIDYLETRSDIQAGKLGYLGFSWGGFMGGIMPAVEKRIKVIVLYVGGMGMTPALPEVDQINFLPRVVQPVLMLNGKHDMYFPVETAQKPMFDFLGTPKKDKKIIIYESGHLVPKNEFVKETLSWYDKYLGPVK